MVKTAVSLPDELFEQVEELAKEMKISRSEVFQEALRLFIRENDDNSVTSRLNAVYKDVDSALDAGFKEIRNQSLGLRDESW